MALQIPPWITSPVETARITPPATCPPAAYVAGVVPLAGGAGGTGGLGAHQELVTTIVKTERRTQSESDSDTVNDVHDHEAERKNRTERRSGFPVFRCGTAEPIDLSIFRLEDRGYWAMLTTVFH